MLSDSIPFTFLSDSMVITGCPVTFECKGALQSFLLVVMSQIVRVRRITHFTNEDPVLQTILYIEIHVLYNHLNF